MKDENGEDKCWTGFDFNDEIMLNSDMGLYLDFEVDSTGRQTGRSALDNSVVSCPKIEDGTLMRKPFSSGFPCNKNPHTSSFGESTYDKEEQIFFTNSI